MFFPKQSLISKTKSKVFCIGKNKTGTTSVGRYLETIGFKLASQRPFEEKIDEWYQNDFDKILKLVETSGEAFQDIPFSLNNTFKVLEEKYPNGKFILTIRDSPDEWYNSLTKFQAKLFGLTNVPSKKILENSDYVYKGWMYKVIKYDFNTPDNDLFNEKILKGKYENHNQDVLDYFEDKHDKLLVINVKDQKAPQRICDFLQVPVTLDKMPWLNKT